MPDLDYWMRGQPMVVTHVVVRADGPAVKSFAFWYGGEVARFTSDIPPGSDAAAIRALTDATAREASVALEQFIGKESPWRT